MVRSTIYLNLTDIATHSLFPAGRLSALHDCGGEKFSSDFVAGICPIGTSTIDYVNRMISFDFNRCIFAENVSIRERRISTIPSRGSLFLKSLVTNKIAYYCTSPPCPRHLKYIAIYTTVRCPKNCDGGISDSEYMFPWYVCL